MASWPGAPTSSLKVFEPLSAFEPGEREYWARYAAQPDQSAPSRPVVLFPGVGVGGAIATLVAEREDGDVLRRDGGIYVCPHRTRLRLLASLLAFHHSIPPEALSAFIEKDDVDRAGSALERIRAEHPKWRNHILESRWEVPLRWFVLFDETERVLTGTTETPIVRYETTIKSARARATHALSVLREALPSPAVVGLVGELAQWISRFSPEGLLVLDYGGVARVLGGSGVADDRTCHEIWGAIGALADGDPDQAAAFYGAAAERWSSARSIESSN